MTATVLKKEETVKLKRSKKNLEDYSWCTYCKKFHKKEAFYNNVFTSDGLAYECKIASRAKYDSTKFMNILHSLPKKEQRLYI